MVREYPSFLVGQNAPERRRNAHRVLRDLSKRLAQVRGLDSLLSVEREPDNPYDERAVAVYLRSPRTKLGYIPQRHGWVCDALEEGTVVDVYVNRIERKGLLNRKYLVDLALRPLK